MMEYICRGLGMYYLDIKTTVSLLPEMKDNEKRGKFPFV